MKTTIQKRYAIKVGTSYLAYVGADNLTSSVVYNWPNKAAAQACASYLRNDFKPEDGDVVVVEFPLLVRK